MKYGPLLGVGLFVGLLLYLVGGWWLMGMCATGFLAWLCWPFAGKSDLHSAEPTSPAKDDLSPRNKLVPGFTPTHEQLQQIEQARQSSLASLQKDEQRRKALQRQSRSPKAALKIEPIALPDLVEFNYRKADGVRSRRTVQVNRVNGANIIGFCRTSGSVKTFKVERIEGEVLRMESGELMDPMTWLLSIQSHTKRT